MSLCERLSDHYRLHGEYPKALDVVGSVNEDTIDPYTKSEFLYVTATDQAGRRYACLLAAAGNDREFQVEPHQFRAPSVGKFPRHWTPPIEVYYRMPWGEPKNTERGDLCIQLIRGKYCTNDIDVRVRPLDPGEIRSEENTAPELGEAEQEEAVHGEDGKPPPTSRAPPALRAVLEKSTSVFRRMKAVDALPNNQSKEALAFLRSLLKDEIEDEALRNNVANRLRKCGDPNLVPDLTEMLWDEQETPKWRNYCVQHLRLCYEKGPDPAILETLFKATESGEKQVRGCAVWSLARIATPRDASKRPEEQTLKTIRAVALVALQEKDAHFLITTAGVQSCARLGLKEALPDIRALAASDGTKPPTLRTAAVAALGDLEDIESVPLLKRLEKEATGQLRSAAQLALKRIKKAKEEEKPEVAPEGRF